VLAEGVAPGRVVVLEAAVPLVLVALVSAATLPLLGRVTELQTARTE